MATELLSLLWNADSSRSFCPSFQSWRISPRKAKGISRNQLADTLNIAPRYIASIENSGQHPSLQILYELVTLLDVSVDQFFFPEREQEKSTRRRQLDTMLDTMSETDLKIIRFSS